MRKQGFLIGMAFAVILGGAAERKEIPCDPVRALELRMNAMLEANDAKRAELLFQSVEADPLHETRSAELLSSLMIRYRDEKFFQRIDKFCAEHPASLPGALLRCMYHKDSGNNTLLVETLKRNAGALQEAPEGERQIWLALFGTYLENRLSAGVYEETSKEAQQLCRQLDSELQRQALESLTGFLYRAAFRRLYVQPGGKNWGTLPHSPLKDDFDSVLAALRSSEMELSPAEREKRFQFYMAGDNPAAMDYARKNIRCGTPGAEKMLLAAALQFAEPEEFERALLAVPDSIVQQEMKRFLYAMQRKDYSSAEKVIARQEPGRFRELLQFAYWEQTKDFARLRAKTLELLDAGIFSPQLLNALLLVAEKQKDPALLRRAYALAGSTVDAGSANSLGYVSAVLGTEWERAEKMLQFALQQEPENCAYLDSFGWLRYRQGRFAEAKKLLEQALLNALPRVGAGVILEHAGDIALALGNKTEAARYWKAALQSNDPDVEVPALRKKLNTLETR